MNNLDQAKELCTRLLLIPFEGYAKKLPNGDCKAYPDPATGGFPWTIGYGSTYHADGTSVQPNEVWTKEYSIRTKQTVLDKFLVGLLKLSPSLINESPNRIAAVLSLVYNIGLGNYKISNLRRKINNKDYEDLEREFLKWNTARVNGVRQVMKGLTRRRQAEYDLFAKGIPLGRL